MTGTIEGVVSTDEGDGIEGATITVADAATERLEATTTSDETGQYSVSVAPDTYDVRAETIGFVAKEERVTVRPDETKKIDFTLAELSANVVGEITDGPGIGVLGRVADNSGSSIGVQGEVTSDAGYGLYTPNDARIDGTIDTTGRWEVAVNGKRSLRLAAAKEMENRRENYIASGNAVVGYLNAVNAGVIGAVIAGGGLYNQDDDEPLGNRITDHFGTIGGGVDNMVGDDDDEPGSADGGTVGGGFHNEATDRNATVAGGRGNEASGLSSMVSGGFHNEASGLSSTVSGGSSNTVSNRESTIGGGRRNTANGARSTVGGGRQNTASGTRSTVSGGELNEGSGERSTVGGGGRNEASGARSTVSGGRQNTASGMYATVGGGERIEASGARSTVCGGIGNTASGEQSAVGGGLANTASGENTTVGGGRFNEASGEWSTVGGGAVNKVSGKQSVVGGGRENEAQGPRNTIAGGYENSVAGWTSTVGGGFHNEASGNSSTVSGGWTNTASDRSSTVGGGEENTASGDRATVPGGFLNTAGGDFSFAVGRQAKANHNGAVVFGDSSSTEIVSTDTDEARFQMEVHAPEFKSTSARSAKTNVEPVNPIATLEGVKSLEISTWEFRERNGGRHLGPMAAEFAETFGLDDDGSIATVDADGVALAAIQGLSQALDEKDDRIADLEQGNEELRNRYSDLLDRVNALEDRL